MRAKGRASTVPWAAGELAGGKAGTLVAPASGASRGQILAPALRLSSGLWPPALLLIVGCIGVLIAVTGRGAFFDEAVYLVAGRTLVFRGENWHFETWFVGSPFAFPVLAGVVERLGGGLVAVRLVNVGFLLGAVWAVYRSGRALSLPAPAPLLGAASFGLAGPVLFTGSFATYDMPALADTALALWLILAGTAGGRLRPAPLLAAGAILGAAVLVKYVVIAVAPALLAVAAVRLLPLERRALRPSGWRRPLAAAALVAAPATVIVAAYAQQFWRQMTLVFSGAGGHTTDYGASAAAILFAILLYLGAAWLLALAGLETVRGHRRTFAVGVVLIGGSLLMPFYHLWKVDPLALFKHVAWSFLLLAPLQGIALAHLLQRPRRFAFVGVVLLLIAGYQVATLRAFYPDPEPAAAWLQTRVDARADPLLVDNVWPYRLALAETFEGREWWVVDQWWWQDEQATPALWRDLVGRGAFSYIVFERGGAFSGRGAKFDDSVIEAVQASGRYRQAASFPSRVSWGNSVVPPPFRGQLQPYGVVHTEIWERTP